MNEGGGGLESPDAGARSKRLDPSIPAERRELILEHLGQQRFAHVDELSTAFQVSPVTIRRDLKELERLGIVERVHGGARTTRRQGSFSSRSRHMAEAKRAIGRKAAELVPDQSTLMIDIGSTTFYLAKALGAHEGLVIVTPSIYTGLELHEHGRHEVIFPGGRLHGNDELSLVGAAAREALDALRADQLFLGVGGIRRDRGYVYFDMEETDIRRTMVGCASRITVLADHTKFEQEYIVSLGPLSLADTLVTDQPPGPELAAALESAGVSIVIADQPHTAQAEASQ